MSEETFLQRLRKKPQAVRERMVLLTVIVVSPILFAVWVFTSPISSGGTSVNISKTISDTVSGTFSNPVYEETFGSPGIKKTEPVDTVVPAENSDLIIPEGNENASSTSGM